MDKYLRPCIAELIGTFFLCFIGAGAICTNELLKSYGMQGSGLVGVAIAHGLALAIGVTATMAISGGHLNPAVTITMWVYKRIDTDKALFYILFQLLGAVFAGGLIALLFQGQTAVAAEARFGAPHIDTTLLQVREDTNPLRIWAWGAAIEAILTFLLVFSIFGTAVDPRAPKVGGFAIGLTIAADILMGGPLTGAAMNPARAFGPALWEAGIVGWSQGMSDQLVYWVGPIVGGLLAGGLYVSYIMPPEEATPHAHHGKA
jgi:aquaporin Z